jgi:Septum formation
VRWGGPVAVVVVLGLAGCGDDGGADEPPVPSVPEVPGTSIYDLRPGDCLSGLAEGQDLRVRVVDCDRRHQAEVYGVVPLTSQDFPGVGFVRQEAATRCAEAFALYTGEPAGPGTDLAFTEVVPTLQSWSAGDREALCLALAVEGRALHATIRDSA